MTFTKRHYEAIASIISTSVAYKEKRQLVNALANYFERDNSRFDRQKFVKACE